MSPRSALRVIVAAAMVLGSSALGLVATVPAAAQEGTPGGSEVTVSGTGEFKDLRVAVSQTKNLINQVVKISWTGIAPTDQPSRFVNNYLQIMQCWGDDPKGPDRTQCQFGGTDLLAGTFAASRQLSYGGLRDEKETEFRGPDRPGESDFVPFWAVGQDRPTRPANSNRNDFFDAQVTNEIPAVATDPDRKGEAFFEVQTVRQAAGLGCGAPTEGATVGRSCWLVIVPRGTTEVDGSTLGTAPLVSSPLSQTNWDNRIQVPLEFQPVGQACPIGAPERPVLGHELAVEAVGRWQPALCGGGGASFAFTQLTDDLTRRQQLEGSRPGLTVFTNPIPADQQPPERPVVYAPVALSGLTIAFQIERDPWSGDDEALAGKPFREMKLTPRLVAKLLSQSYTSSIIGTPQDRTHIEGNPFGLTRDPEFLAENPEYKRMDESLWPADAIVQISTSDTTALLWSWVVADPVAKAFLEGTPDEFGMKVNPRNKGLELPASSFPRNDNTCLVSNLNGVPPFSTCTLDRRPFANDMHEAGRAASRGDTLGRNGEPPVIPGVLNFSRAPRQPNGQRSLLAVVDAATAARYGLPTAKLRNKAGQFVAADTQGLLAGLAAMKPSAVAGVLQPDLATVHPPAYPLTALSYAATSPPTLDAAAGKDYAVLLRFAADPGQEPGDGPGTLPAGYVPLPEPLREQTRAAAAKIEAEAGKSTEPPPSPPAPNSPGATAPDLSGPAAPDTSPPGDTSPPSDTSPNAPPSAVIPPGIALAPAAAPPAVTQRPVTGVRLTPATAITAMGGLLVALLISGALAAGLAPVAHRLGAPQRAAPEKDPEKEVVPTGP